MFSCLLEIRYILPVPGWRLEVMSEEYFELAHVLMNKQSILIFNEYVIEINMKVMIRWFNPQQLNVTPQYAIVIN